MRPALLLALMLRSADLCHLVVAHAADNKTTGETVESVAPQIESLQPAVSADGGGASATTSPAGSEADGLE